MKTFNYDVKVKQLIVSPKRHKQALILCKNSNNQFVLGKKDSYYPDGISRMVGGGVKEDEDPKLGAMRELNEELKIDVVPENLIELSQIKVVMHLNEVVHPLDYFVYYYDLKDTPIIPSDDITSFAYLTLEELDQLVNKLKALSGYVEAKHDDEDVKRDWSDWGNIQGFVLEKTLESLSELNILN